MSQSRSSIYIDKWKVNWTGSGLASKAMGTYGCGIRFLSLPPQQEIDLTEAKNCGCGRSPTGKCIGWHAFTNEEYEAKKKSLNESTEKKLLAE